ncbi:unnamed protein product [Acanthoscelides obtectus]|uniref:Uncharacterized protein n=1 Tax=Acanthoscelides obtectus TaxID=200917 RepID=A0A9P0LSY4_ACAOB|nr:unnamed protein product [Acanthoscelides obtectus]CAK1650679.1 hypothetical protein AOBTE_LOCUS16862 [Acanthoscelides obtectus]
METILFAEVNINKFSPFGGISFIKFPHFIEKKKAIINVQNKDEYCFAWAVISALMPAHDHASQTSSYPHFSTILNMKDVTPIIPLRSDEQNEFDIATIYNICEKPFSGEDIKVRDHCHITGKALLESLNDEDFIETKKYFTDPRVLNMMRQKGVFPYSYLDTSKKLEQEILPSKRNFEWMNEGKISAFELGNVEEHGEDGYVLEVYVQYLESLHDSHSDLPFLVESMIPPNAKSKIPKLIPNLYIR